MLLSPTLRRQLLGAAQRTEAPAPPAPATDASDAPVMVKNTAGSQGQWLGVLGVGGGLGFRGCGGPRRSCCHLLCHAHLRSPRGEGAPRQSCLKDRWSEFRGEDRVAISCPPEPSPPWGGRPGWGSWVVLDCPCRTGEDPGALSCHLSGFHAAPGWRGRPLADQASS